MDLEPIGIPRRRPPGSSGGRPVSRPFHFAPYDEGKYPSESEAIRSARIDPEPEAGYPKSWTWALSKAAAERLWIVIPISDEPDGGAKAELNRTRSSIFTTARRRGTPVTSQYIAPNLYVTVTR